MSPAHINLICSVVAVAFAVAIVGAYWLSQRAAKSRRLVAVASRAPVSEESIVRSYLVYVDGLKMGANLDAALSLSTTETVLQFTQIVPGIAPGYRRLLKAFTSGSTLNVGVGPLDESALQLGDMRVEALSVFTDMKTCVTKVNATLRGPSLSVRRGSVSLVASEN